MKPEAAEFLGHARRMLERAPRTLRVSLFEDAGRTAYMAAFHAAQALIFEREDRVMKTHHGVRSEFHRITRGVPGIDAGIDPNLPAFLSRAYRMKTAADYELGGDMQPSPEEVIITLDAASQFVVAITNAISTPTSP
ncbi:MAG TPA: HEPN domain-containing protein [Acetobacteraceae bacterium]|jgi:uncharacterized protein (UPF0332 family)|nr:HEPN domain-containing protein [Acetobacteraceae bacterium]